jgi:hypothetical protein
VDTSRSDRPCTRTADPHGNASGCGRDVEMLQLMDVIKEQQPEDRRLDLSQYVQLTARLGQSGTEVGFSGTLEGAFRFLRALA